MTQAAVARKLGFFQAVISAFERTGHMPRSIFTRRDRAAELKSWFEGAGVEFSDGEERGVRLRKPKP